MKKLKATNVTVVDSAGLVWAVVVALESTTAFLAQSSNAQHRLLNHDEDVTWCRGHVQQTSDCGKALLVAFALSGKPTRKAAPLESTADRFIKGEITEVEFQNNLDLFDEDLINGFS